MGKVIREQLLTVSPNMRKMGIRLYCQIAS